MEKNSEGPEFIFLSGMKNMYYSEIKNCDIANGTGVRVTLFVSGCRNRCKGCFQPETWDFCHGSEFDEAAENKILEYMKPGYIAGLTLLGGDPFEEENQAGLIDFLRTVKRQYPEKNIWAFTGYLYEDLLEGGRKHTEFTDEMLSYINMLIDGPFIEEKKDLMLKFRGSENQRLIDMDETRKAGSLVLSPLNF